MAQAIIYSKTGAKKESPAKLSTKVFGVEANHELLALANRAHMANKRQVSASTLTRGEVRGGGRKPWKQKGTGRARAGSIRIPHWKGGGVTFGPSGEENYSLRLNTKTKRASIRQALSLQAADKKVVILESFDGGEGRVKPTITLLDKIKLEGKILMVVAEKTDAIDRATRNISGVNVVSARYLNAYSVLNADWLVMTNDAHKVVTDWLEAGV